MAGSQRVGAYLRNEQATFHGVDGIQETKKMTHKSTLPALEYRPRNPENYRPGIGLIGCGAITMDHLRAYRKAGYKVIAMCDIDADKAKERRKEFFPDATIYTDYVELLRNETVEIVDIATHPPDRPPIIKAALLAGRHVLSQKPFVLDLDVGQQLVELADKQGVRLAVNQNGRWAPHFSYIRAAIKAGLIGQVAAAHLSVHWDHGWVQGTEFEKVHHLVLYDFAIHWFDIVQCFLGPKKPQRVYASVARWPGQPVAPPLLAQALIEFDGAQASLAFDAYTCHQPHDRTYVAGTKGTIMSRGPDFKKQTVRLENKDGVLEPELEGVWFPDGFHGTMGELLCSIEENREPTISARENLKSLELCFAAVASAEQHFPIVPGSVRRMPG
jgi:predicted dehydrogenase